MGRRPTVKKDGALPARDPRVQAKIDDITCEILDQLKDKLSARVAAGDLEDVEFKELMKHFNDMVKATKLPPSSITAIQIPVTQQLPEPKKKKQRTIPKVLNPEDKKALRESSRRFLDKQ